LFGWYVRLLTELLFQWFDGRATTWTVGPAEFGWHRPATVVEDVRGHAAPVD
jgi:hypothetical protein